MRSWEITLSYALITQGGKPDPSRIWGVRNKETGKTDWDTIQELARSGWELVSATPITYNGQTVYVLFTFKRPLGDGSYG
jgi:hypothetical protein